MRYISNQVRFQAFRIIDVRQSEIGLDGRVKSHNIQLESDVWIIVPEEASARRIPPLIGDYFISGRPDRVIPKDEFETTCREDENQSTE
jgi:hypothetical protein